MKKNEKEKKATATKTSKNSSMKPVQKKSVGLRILETIETLTTLAKAIEETDKKWIDFSASFFSTRKQEKQTAAIRKKLDSQEKRVQELLKKSYELRINLQEFIRMACTADNDDKAIEILLKASETVNEICKTRAIFRKQFKKKVDQPAVKEKSKKQS